MLGLISVHIIHALLRLSFTLWRQRVHGNAEGSQEEDSLVPQTPDPETFQFYLAWWHSTQNRNGEPSPVKDRREWAIFWFSVARLTVCFVLLGLSIWTFAGCPEEFGTGCWNRSPEVHMALTYVSFDGSGSYFPYLFAQPMPTALRVASSVHIHVRSRLERLRSQV